MEIGTYQSVPQTYSSMSLFLFHTQSQHYLHGETSKANTLSLSLTNSHFLNCTRAHARRGFCIRGTALRSKRLQQEEEGLRSPRPTLIGKRSKPSFVFRVELHFAISCLRFLHSFDFQRCTRYSAKPPLLQGQHFYNNFDLEFNHSASTSAFVF